jgi:hypothetical protein
MQNKWMNCLNVDLINPKETIKKMKNIHAIETKRAVHHLLQFFSIIFAAWY